MHLSPSHSALLLATLATLALARLLHPPSLASAQWFSAYFLAYAGLGNAALLLAARLRHTRLSARSSASPSTPDSSLAFVEKGASAGRRGHEAAPTGLSHACLTEGALVLFALGCGLVTIWDGWRLVAYSLAPDCYVMDHGVRTSETCEHFEARVGQDNLIRVNP